MLTAFGAHGSFDLTVAAKGDVEIEAHHTVEDTAIVLGQALGRPSATRMASAASVTPASRWTRPWPTPSSTSPGARTACTPASPSTCCTPSSAATRACRTTTVINRHVFESIAINARIALHVRVLYGRDPHHITEAEFKAVARALRAAVESDPRVTGVPSTKGVL